MAEVRRSDEGGVLTVTFTRDEKLNAVTPDMLDALRVAVTDLGEDEQARVLVITAEGRHFTAGMDITTLAAQGGGEGNVLRRSYRRLHLLLDEIEAIEKPVVLAAQGPCRGFGLELAASCDFRICSDRTVFGLPEIANLAVLPGSGGISRLTRLIALSGEALGLAKVGIAAAASADRGSARDFDRVANTLLLKTPEHRAQIEAFTGRAGKR
jgi:enoyl-CoA hydratase